MEGKNMDKQQLLEKINKTTTIPYLEDLNNEVINLNDKLVNLNDKDISAAYHQKMTELLSSAINAANSAVEITNLAEPVDHFDEDDLIVTFCNKVITIASNTTDTEGLNLLEKTFIKKNLNNNTTMDQDNKIKTSIILQLIAASTTISDLKDIKDEVSSLHNDNVTAAYNQKKESL